MAIQELQQRHKVFGELSFFFHDLAALLIPHNGNNLGGAFGLSFEELSPTFLGPGVTV